VVEGARLESVCRGNSTEGSNPSLSASSQAIKYKGTYLIHVALPRVGHLAIGTFVDLLARNQAAVSYGIAPSHTGRGRRRGIVYAHARVCLIEEGGDPATCEETTRIRKR
jgi:hypothetical protein